MTRGRLFAALLAGGRALRVLAVNVLVLAAGLVAVELIFGSWFGSRALNHLHVVRDLRLQHEVAELYESEEAVAIYSRDRYGLRGAYADPGRIRILTVGGSTTDQRYLCDGKTWQDVLQRKFGQAGRDVPVANAGIDGQSTFGHIAAFEGWFPEIPGLAPELIVFYVGINDFHKDAPDRFDRVRRVGRGAGLVEALRQNSALWHLARTLYGAYKAVVISRIGHRRVHFDQVEWSSTALQADLDFVAPRLDAYRERLRTLVELTRGLGANPVFVTQPTHYVHVVSGRLEGEARVNSYDGHAINGLDIHRIMRLQDRVAAEVARERGVLFVDLAARSDWSDADFYDFVHMTPAGARKVGELLYDALKDAVPSRGDGRAPGA